MVKHKKKFESGAATAYVSRNRALKKLQLSLPDFRRLCILKGIYPHEPRHKKKVGKGSTAPKTYYFYKDIQFMAHEPIIQKFRAFKIFVRKLKKALAKNESDKAMRLRNNKPKYQLDHIIKERYPTFIDAIRDLEDCLSMSFLFSTFPKTRKTHSEIIHLCRRLTVEFMHYVIASKSLRKVFISIKGIYFQVEILGQTITWVIPHKYGYDHPEDVDYKIMATFVEFYTTMLGFINFKLYNSLNLHYPPKLSLETEPVTSEEKDACSEAERLEERLAAMTQTLKSVVDDSQEEEVEMDEFPASQSDDPDIIEQAKVEQEKLKKFQNLFKGLKFFLNREVPRETLVFVIRSFGGEVSWDKTVAVGATYSETDETITHQIVDRPNVAKQYLSRYYVQPQWLFDCVNARKLLPVEDYFLGAILPPHLSPFVEEGEDDYVPPERLEALEEDSGVNEDSEEEDVEENDNEGGDESDEDVDEEEEEEEDSDVEEDEDSEEEDAALRKQKKRKLHDVEIDHMKRKKREMKVLNMSVEAGTVETDDVEKKLKKQTDEERKLSEMMIPKKKRRLYNKIMYSKKKKAQEVNKLKQKREAYDKAQKAEKKKKRKVAA
ncbi:pescadillo homolog [Lingula anatina]|uniref:Pescadillo homolog n=1 Tax=Lingula anatina TaxID=7574 RepID=A0A1S3JDC0_LINAN|nr:pescadillo homolog [Lingula anatina]|eukprot:XP_013408166.1 pescadillo homolog [Lingula anatina]